ncbi:MAG: hypothetical protein M3Q68_02805 [Actinomycetota bacterium]|nr:hypothetical protein [Actinomycetota bacterium]
MGALGRLLWRTAVRKGFFGGSRNWMTVFAVIGAVKAFRRVAGGTQDVVYSEELLPGQALIITHHADVRLGDKP